MTDPKPSTNDILAKIRAKASAPVDAAASGSAVPGEPSGQASAAPEKVESAPKPAAPSSTSDILAAARAKAGAAKPAAAAGAPKSPADIMAAIKAGGKPAAPAAGASSSPKSPADVMAAIRGGAGAAAAKPAAKPVAVAASAPAAATAAGLSAAEMIRAARGSDAGVASPKVALPSKPLPGKAAGSVTGKPELAVEPRRGFIAQCVSVALSPVVVAWGAFIGALTVSTLGLARFMMPNVLVEPPTRFKIGPPNDYAPGTVSTKWQAQFGIWVVNAEVDGAAVIYALSTVCTHLGCTPNWLEGEQKFKCPCHGSGFYKSGVNFEGPAPRPLERFGLRLAEDGMLEVDKSLKFQKELGQWSNPSCFVPVA